MPPREVKRVEKPWGFEIWYAETAEYAGKLLHISRGRRLSRQFHRVKEETIYVHSGRLQLDIGRDGEIEAIELGPGESYHLPPGTVHRMTAIEDTDVLEVSTPQLDDVVRIEDDYGRD